MKPFESTIPKLRGLNKSAALLTPGDMSVARNIDLCSGPEKIGTRRGSRRIGESSEVGNPDRGVIFPVDGSDFVVWRYLFGKFYSRPYEEVSEVEEILSAALTITGNVLANLFAPYLTGLTRANTDSWVLYYTIESVSGPLLKITLYKDSARTEAVAEGTGNGKITISELDDSGISGWIVTNDPDIPAPEDGTIGYGEYLPGGGTNTTEDMKVRNGRIYAFCAAGNSVIEWREDEQRFAARPLGLAPVALDDWSLNGSGDIKPFSQYTYGIEKVIQRAGGDIVATGPRRRFVDGSMPTVTFEDTAGSTILGLGAPGAVAALDDDPYWTHLRLHRSRNRAADLSDPLFPIDALGTPDELYETALIPRWCLYGEGLNALPTGAEYPPGNAGVSVGIAGGEYQIQDGTSDDMLAGMLDLDYIDLEQFPACSCGDWKSGKLFGAPPDSPYAVYSPASITPYQEQWDPQARLNTGNTHPITGITAAWQHLVFFTAVSTMYLPGSDVEAVIQEVDGAIGVGTSGSFAALREIGIMAICADRMIRILGRDLRWRQVLGKVELAINVYPLVASPALQKFSCASSRGKVIVCLSDPSMTPVPSVMLALHYADGKGWTSYDFPGAPYPAMVLQGSSGSVAVLDGAGQHLEIEIDGLDTDWDWESEGDVPIETEWSMGDFIAPPSNLIDIRRFVLFGSFTADIDVRAVVQGQAWDMQPAYAQPGLWAATPGLQQREYWFTAPPVQRAPWGALPLRGRTMSFIVKTTGPMTLYWGRAVGVSMPAPANADAFSEGGMIGTGPGWASLSQVRLNFEDPGDTFFDAARAGLSHAWVASGGAKVNRVTQVPGRGLKFRGGAVTAAAGQVVVRIGEGTWTWRMVLKLEPGCIFVASGQEGEHRWQLQAGGCGLRMTVEGPGDIAREYQTPDVWLDPDVVYGIIFTLGKNLTGRFLCVAPMDAAKWPGAPRTTQQEPSSLPTLPDGHQLRFTGLSTAYGTISYYDIEKADCREEDAKRFWGTTKAW